MISSAVSDATEWHVIDPKYQEIGQRLSLLGVPAENIVGHDSVPAFVDEYEGLMCNGMSQRLLQELDTNSYRVGDKSPIMIKQRREGPVAIVTKTTSTNHKVILQAVNITERHQIEAGIPAEYPRRDTLLECLATIRTEVPVVVRFDSSPDEYLVLGASDPRLVKGALAVLDWVVMEAQSQPTTRMTAPTS
jgi:hypothetical protein